MRDRLEMIFVLLVLLACAVTVTYGLARAGEPQAAWFWFDVIGAER